MWVFCPGHADVYGNEQVDKLAGLAPVGGQLLYDRNEVIKTLWYKVWHEELGVRSCYLK